MTMRQSIERFVACLHHFSFIRLEYKAVVELLSSKPISSFPLLLLLRYERETLCAWSNSDFFSFQLNQIQVIFESCTVSCEQALSSYSTDLRTKHFWKNTSNSITSSWLCSARIRILSITNSTSHRLTIKNRSTLVPEIVYLYTYRCMASAASFFIILYKLAIALESRRVRCIDVETTYHSNCSRWCFLYSSSSSSPFSLCVSLSLSLVLSLAFSVLFSFFFLWSSTPFFCLCERMTADCRLPWEN